MKLARHIDSLIESSGEGRLEERSSPCKIIDIGNAKRIIRNTAVKAATPIWGARGLKAELKVKGEQGALGGGFIKFL